MAERREVFKESTNFKKEHDEVFQILDWLAVKGVTKIIKLVVPDRLVNPHDELEMARYVRNFQETCTADHATKLLDEIRELQQDRLLPGHKINAYEPMDVPWYPSPSPADLSKMPTRVAILDNGVLSISPVASEISASRVTKDQGLPVVDKDVTNPRTNSIGIKPTVGNVAGGASGTQTPQQQQPGMVGGGSSTNDEGGKGLWSRIKAGRSFVDSNSKFCPWQFPSDPHGTQTANLICALDPLCEIYVARVAEDAFGIKADNVAKAIEWAIQEEVDIISMSFALSSDSDTMFDMVKLASSLVGIVMTCSTHDEGSRAIRAYPAAYRKDDRFDSIIVLAACDE
ncbi:hypothetical protein Sste5346_009076 [Sporothrix stenoceras]|uniref:Peptidase S8/S53 domain-containing protein n=1 Tax=Sporothrix stenoceras TaxID=5173 RepID=A0ABR3YM53_9PEZI